MQNKQEWSNNMRSVIQEYVSLQKEIVLKIFIINTKLILCYVILHYFYHFRLKGILFYYFYNIFLIVLLPL